MTDLERFKAIVNFQEPDYVPLFGFPGAPGMSRGCMKFTHDRLRATGMPHRVGGIGRLGQPTRDLESWQRYWGTTGPTEGPRSIARGVTGFRETRRVEGDYEIIESESGAVTRQVIDNDVTYSMPEFVRYPVRDRASWEFWKERMTPNDTLTDAEIDAIARRYTDRDRPLTVGVGGMYGILRSLFGPEELSVMFYEDPQLVHDAAQWRRNLVARYALPLLRRLKPEIVHMGEDLCYNHGMLLSPAHFHEFCGAHYRMVCDAARENGADLVAVDTDGNYMEFAEVAVPYGVNGIFPSEVKAGNDLFELRARHPRLVLFGWLEKEVINEGNDDLIEPEIMRKVPELLEKRGYFPNGDHGIQPLATFPGLCKFMTLLHEVCGNPEGTFPRT